MKEYLYAGFILGILSALLMVGIARAMADAHQKNAKLIDTARRGFDPDELAPLEAFALRSANIDASRLAGALEAGLRSGWPFNTLVTRALHEHYERVGRRQFERNARLN